MKAVEQDAGLVGMVWRQLSSCLNLPYTGAEQSWDLEMADASRLAEFISFYEIERLSEIARKELMRLILASTNDAIEQGCIGDGELSRINRLISEEYSLHRSTVRYWACVGCVGDDDQENLFPLSSFAKLLIGKFENPSQDSPYLQT